MKKIKVNFYADTFRSCEIEVPDGLEKNTETSREYVIGLISLALRAAEIYPPSGKKDSWLCETGFIDRCGCWHPWFRDKNCIQIITAKII